MMGKCSALGAQGGNTALLTIPPSPHFWMPPINYGILCFLSDPGWHSRQGDDAPATTPPWQQEAEGTP